MNIERDPADGVFTASQRFIVCSDVSNTACEKAMPWDAEHCGDVTHQRLVDQRWGQRLFVPQRTERQTLAFGTNDDLSWERQAVDFDPVGFDPTEIRVSRSFQESFTAYHRASPEEAISNAHLVLDRAARTGSVKTDAAGWHVFGWRGFKVIVTPGLDLVTRYLTKHYERTPQMVADGVKSRLKGVREDKHLRKQRIPKERRSRPVPEHLEVGDVIDGTVASIVNFGVFVSIGEIDVLVHRSTLPDPEVNLNDVFEKHVAITVRLIEVDRESERVTAELVDEPLAAVEQ